MFALWSANPYLTSFLLGPLVLAVLLVYPALLFFSPKEKDLSSSAYFYVTNEDDTPQSLPRLQDKPSVQLSIVIPAFNEESRLSKMLQEAINYLQTLEAKQETISAHKPITADRHNGDANDQVADALLRPLQSFEILVVDDGSTDKTADVALQFSRDNSLHDVLRLVRLGQNCGKGRAVRHGVLHSRGALIAFCDADGATRFSDISAITKEMARIMTSAGHGIVCGSRAHLVGSEAVVKRSFARNFLMHSFHFILSLLMRPPNPFAFLTRLTQPSRHDTRKALPVQPPIQDTQCGFKLFTRPSAQVVFPLAHIDRWIFDVELLLLAEMASSQTLRQKPQVAIEATREPAKDVLLRLPLPISEVAVEWKEVEGSKIDILKDSVGMAFDLVVIRLNYTLGRWVQPTALDVKHTQQENGDVCCRS